MEYTAYFQGVTGAGDLYLEHIFYEFEGEPIVFTCVNREKELYLCLCSEIRSGQKWMISPCDTRLLWELVEEKRDLVSAFRSAGWMIAAEMDLQGNERSEIVDAEEVDELDLPKEGLVLRCDKESARQYLVGKRNISVETISYNLCIGAEKTTYITLHEDKSQALDNMKRYQYYSRLMTIYHLFRAYEITEYSELKDGDKEEEEPIWMDTLLMAA